MASIDVPMIIKCFVSLYVALCWLGANVAGGGEDCSEAYECENSIFNTDIVNITAGGYKSLSGSVVSYSNNINCLGSFCGYDSFSLHSISSISSKGSVGVSKTGTVETENGNINCRSTYDCGDTILQSKPGTIYCNGDQSCSNTLFKGSNTIVANGAYSLYNSEISTVDLDSSNTLDVTIDGYYGGLNTIITCQSGFNCTVYCMTGNNACINITMDCEDNSNCSMICDNNNCGNNYNYNGSMAIGMVINTEEQTMINDMICNDNSYSNNVSFTFDDGYDSMTSDDSTNNIAMIDDLKNVCFRGYKSGMNNNITVMDLKNNDSNIICCAALSCTECMINIDNSV